MAFQLTKHHALGNDFLVLLGPAADLQAVGSDRARRWCDRHRGLGADGLLLGTTDEPGADLRMTLYNADGSLAEMSGNGIRCLAHAEARRRDGAAVSLRIVTDGGPRVVEVDAPTPDDPATVQASVDMGPARPGPEADVVDIDDALADTGPAETLGLDATKRGTYDLGNPHLVLLVDDPEVVDLVAAGSLHEAAFSPGINVHFISPTAGEADAVSMRVWERGAGATEACGTGAVAVARAAHDWGIVGHRVTVHMPGGDVEVRVGDPMVLVGPATYVATITIDS